MDISRNEAIFKDIEKRDNIKIKYIMLLIFFEN